MAEYELSPEVEDDLFEIWSSIADDSVAAANWVEKTGQSPLQFL